MIRGSVGKGEGPVPQRRRLSWRERRAIEADAAEAAATESALPLSLMLSLALGVARGVEFLHAKGVVHRDLKVQNPLNSYEQPWQCLFSCSHYAGKCKQCTTNAPWKKKKQLLAVCCCSHALFRYIVRLNPSARQRAAH